MSSRPDITLALDVRSYERVVAVSNPESVYDYPEHWERPTSVSEAYVDDQSVVIVDRVDLSWRSFGMLARNSPRLFAFVTASVDHEKRIRRMVTALFPWSEVWTVWTTFGKTLITKDARGEAAAWESD